MKINKKQKQNKKIKNINKKTIKRKGIIVCIILLILVIININIDNIFLTAKTKEVTYKLGEYELRNISHEIFEGNVELPFPKELGIETEIGQIFSGYDIDGDGIADYKPGEAMPVKANNTDLDIAVIILEDNIPFSANLYEDKSYIAGTELTSGSNDVTIPWSSDNPVRYLEIVPKFTEGIGGTVQIKLPVGMYFHGDDAYTGAGGSIENVGFETLSGLSGIGEQGVGTYKNSKTGTLTYTFNALATDTEKILIPVAFDIQIWNKHTLENTNFTNGIAPIEVIMTEGMDTYTKTLNDVVFEKKYQNLGLQLVRWYTPSRALLDEPFSMFREEFRQVAGYWEEIVVEYTLPNIDGEYATYIGEDSRSTAAKTTEGLIIDNSDPTKIVYTWTNYYHKTGYLYIAPNLEFSSSKFVPDQNLTSNLKITTTSYGGSEVIFEEAKSIKISEGAEINLYGYTEYLYNNVPENVESHLGHLSIQNIGLGSSKEIDVHYQFDIDAAVGNRNLIDVTSVVLPNVKNTTFTAYCTLVDKYNNIVVTNFPVEATTGSLDMNGAIITIPNVVEKYNTENSESVLNPEEVSFKEIKYKIESIPANTALYQIAAQLSNLKSGNFYGQYNGNTEQARSKMSIVEKKADGTTKENEKIVSLIGTSLNSNSIYFKSAILSDYSSDAGSETTVTLDINQHSYPYGNSQYIKAPVIYFLAPTGIELIEDSINISRGEEIVEYEVVKKEVGTIGETLYSIYAKGDNASFGGSYFDENGDLKSSDAHDNLKFIFNLTSDPASDYFTEKINNMFFVKDLEATNAIHSSYMVKEKYDFEEDGVINDVVKPSTGNSWIVYPNTNQFEFANEIEINDREYSEEENSYILSDSEGNIDKGVASYRLLIQNNSDGLIAGEDFYQYLPIPKVDVIYPNQMDVQNEIVNFELTSVPKIAGDNGLIYDIKYTTKTNLVDINGNLSVLEEEWQTADEIEDLADVTMIKITGLPKTIVQSHTEDIISLSLRYELDEGYSNTGYDAGKILKFNSYGWQKYLDGGVENTENLDTIVNSVNIMLRYVTEYDTKILASYLDTDDNTMKFKLPEYFEHKNIYILGVKEYNVDLVPTSEIISNQDIVDTNITDRNFAITAAIGTSNKLELSEYAGTPIQLGTAYSGYPSTIVFKIENYYNMADAASTKYVDVVLGDDKGIKYTVRLNIERNARHITEPETSIAEGTLYKLINNGKQSIKITQDSSMTMQYDFTYVPAQHENIKLQFTGNMPVGTKLTMIDSSELLVNDNDDYIFETDYYYYEIQNETSSIYLEDFVNMQTLENYVVPEDLRNERTIFTIIVKFEENYMPIGKYTASIIPILKGGSEAQSFDLEFELTEKRTFTVSTSSTNYIIKDDKVDITVNFGTNELTGIDAKYRYEVLALRIRFDQEIPIGSYIEIQDKIYLLEESDFILNYGNYFLIPLGNVDDLEKLEYTLHAPMDNYVGGNIYHEIVFLEEPQGDSYADVTNSFTVIDPKPPALKLNINNSNNLILKQNTSSISLILDYIDYDETTNLTARIYIMEKNEGAYLRRTDLIENTTIDNGIIYPVQGITTINPPDDENEIEIVLNLNENLMEVNKTYRVILETNHLGENKYEDIINFIVVDNAT